ncbi:hypothetical protein [Paraburkholderia aspalathi]|nr:hypothetical protein [Paraburkholderia aspalathi]MBK3817973.1 hypothetical protein [Paraburkholderia aspalathi]MBK3829930.1 hypothetical protein [Paraburkholderia aspalathi]MBK3840086.1 hypothetical protein [Paraburkholderia aspalathi]MBK3859645.1 hypothetical protein [Paraburkholderia aspalathi]
MTTSTSQTQTKKTAARWRSSAVSSGSILAADAALMEHYLRASGIGA